jgi:hypothetical protein
MDETANEKRGLISVINSWWSHPFQSGGSAFNWVLFVGLIILATFLWQLILIELTKEI